MPVVFRGSPLGEEDFVIFDGLALTFPTDFCICNTSPIISVCSHPKGPMRLPPILQLGFIRALLKQKVSNLESKSALSKELLGVSIPPTIDLLRYKIGRFG